MVGMEHSGTHLSSGGFAATRAEYDSVNTKQLWENVLLDIEMSISKANFSTWFKHTRIMKIEDGVAHISVPNEFVKDWLSKKFHKVIVKTLRGFHSAIRDAVFVIAKENKDQVHEQRVVQTYTANGELPLNSYYINKNDNLNPRYMFNAFVVGPFNELAHAAAQAVVRQPGIAYNPLFVYGGTGHGKTHLIQAIGNHVKKFSSEKKIYYITSEKFGVDYLNALQNGKANAFKDKYRQYDVLIMDDVQFLSQKEKMQEELFHLFNALYDNNKQIVFSSDKHPNYIPHLEERLKSRFAQGMIVDIPEPDHESRTAIIRAKAEQNKFFIEDDIIDFVARTIQGNIRDLEGTLNAIICKSQLSRKVLTQEEIKQLIQTNTKPKRVLSTKEVIRQVSRFYEIEEESIYEKSRRKEVVKPRQLVMYILREDFHVSYPSIGTKLGGRDHTTVIHSYEKIKKDLQTDESLSQELSQIRALLQQQ